MRWTAGSYRQLYRWGNKSTCARALFIVEHGYDQGDTVLVTARRRFVEVTLHHDIAGLPRTTIASRVRCLTVAGVTAMVTCSFSTLTFQRHCFCFDHLIC